MTSQPRRRSLPTPLAASRLAVAALAALAALAPGTARAERKYTDDRGATHDCAKEPRVAVVVAGGTFTFTGACESIAIEGASNKVKIQGVRRLAITGSRNTVDVEAADRIGVTGSDNTVNYGRALTGKAPKIASVGSNNKLNQVTP